MRAPITDDETSGARAQPSPAIARVRIPKQESALFLAAVVAVAIFYVGPLLFDIVFNRHPPLEMLKTEAIERASRNNSLGELHTVKSTDFSYSRLESASWGEHVTASGALRVNATLTLEQKADLFRPADFTSYAETKANSMQDFKDAFALAKGLSSQAALPSIPVKPPLFLRESSRGDSSKVEIEFSVFRSTAYRHGYAPLSIFKNWGGLSEKNRRWDISNQALPVVAMPTRTDRKRPLTRENLPKDAVVVGTADFDKAVTRYRAACADYVVAVKKAIADEKSDSLHKAILAEVKRGIASKAYPEDGWVLDSMAPVSVPSPDSGGRAKLNVSVSLRRTQAFYKEASAGERERTLALPKEHAEARRTAERVFPNLVAAWPSAPRLFQVAAPSGEMAQLSLDVWLKVADGKWVPEAVGWPADIKIAKDRAQGIALEEIAKTDVVDDSDAVWALTPKEWRRRQAEVVEKVREAERVMEARFGRDREAWVIMQTAFAAVGGEAELRKQSMFVENVKIRMNFSKSEPIGQGTISHSLPFRRKDQFSLSAKNVNFGYVDSLHSLGGWQKITDRPTEVLLRKGVEDRYRRVFAENILWHLAANDSSSDIRVVSVPNEKPYRLVVKASNMPELTLTISASSGFLEGVMYMDSERNASKRVSMEWRYSGHRNFSGFVRPGIREFYIDGERMERSEVLSVEAATLDPALFRHPLASPPFTGRSNGRMYQLTLRNTGFIPITVVVGDSDRTLFLSANEQATVSLVDGQHTISAEAVVPQFVLKNPRPVEIYQRTITMRNDMSHNISVMRDKNGKVRWEMP